MYKFLIVFDLEYYYNTYTDDVEILKCLETYVYQCDDLVEALESFIEDCDMNIKEIYWKSVKPITILQFVSNDDDHKFHARFDDMTMFDEHFSKIGNR